MSRQLAFSPTPYHGQSPLIATRSDETSGEFFSVAKQTQPPQKNGQTTNARKWNFVGRIRVKIQMKIAKEKNP
jgi:hypothetical protein